MNTDKYSNTKKIRSLISLFEKNNEDNYEPPIERYSKRNSNASVDILVDSPRSTQLTPALSKHSKSPNDIKASRVLDEKDTFDKFHGHPKGSKKAPSSKAPEKTTDEVQHLSSELDGLKLEHEKLKTVLKECQVAMDRLKNELKAVQQRATKSNMDKLKLEQRLKATRASPEADCKPAERDGSQFLALVHQLVVEVHSLYKANSQVYKKSSPWLKQEIFAILGHVRSFCRTKLNGPMSAVDSFKLHCEMNMVSIYLWSFIGTKLSEFFF